MDHNRLNPEIGSPDEYEAFTGTLPAHGLGHLLDVVPNHMGIAQGANRWWNDVLENGPASPCAEFFDIDWEPVERHLSQKVLLPILGEQYGRVLENQDLALEMHAGAFVVFFAASNRKEDKAGVSGMLEPLKDRFATLVELVTAVDDWVGWAIDNNMPFELISYVRYRPEILNDWKPTSDFTRTATPRSLAFVGKMMQAEVPHHMQRRAFSGAIGKERASEFIGFLDIYKDLPDPMDVILNPKTAPLPKDAAASYALCGALSARATEQTIEPIIAYSNRLKDEFSVLLVRDSIMRDREGLCKNNAFIKWVHKHQDVLI